MQNESNVLAFVANEKGIDLLLAPAVRHGQPARIEGQEEKNRLLKMLVATLLGFACLLCLMLLSGALLLTLSWETSYRMPVMMALITACVLGAGIACRRFQDLSGAGTRSFASACAEHAADVGRAQCSAGAGVVHGET
ncbi:MAG: hypothetical protein PSX71_15115 [bacterium]|nr:hypothetical protein [bacterium]